MTASAPPRAGAAERQASLRRAWLGAASILAVGLLCLGALFWGEMAAAIRVWLDSTAYNHCFLVLPVALYLLWERRQVLTAVPPRPEPWFALVALPVSILWFVSERVGVMEGRQLLAMTFLQILFLSVLGSKSWRALSAPLLYLYFLVPFGSSLTPLLQDFTVRFMVTGLDLLRIPNFSNGVTIEIPEGTFLVAEACAGLRFLIASTAFGVLYACVMYTSVWRRLLFIAASLVVPVIANGFRALGIAVLAHLLGSATAAATDHILYGWLFFSIVIFALILLGLPFRQMPHVTEPVAIFPVRGSVAKAALFALVPTVALAAAPRLLANRFDRAAALPIAAGMTLPVPAGCALLASPQPRHPGLSLQGLSAADSRTYRCGSGFFSVWLRQYSPRAGARPLFLQTLPENAGEEIAVRRLQVGRGAGAQFWRIAEFEGRDRYVGIASALWIDGRPVQNAIKGRIRQALTLFRIAPVPPFKAVVAYSTDEGLARGRRALDRFLAGMSPLPKALERALSENKGAVRTFEKQPSGPR